MNLTTEDINAFHAFALGKVSDGGTKSMTELATEWEAARELDESLTEIRQSIADADAGRLISAQDALQQAQQRLDLGE